MCIRDRAIVTHDSDDESGIGSDHDTNSTMSSVANHNDETNSNDDVIFVDDLDFLDKNIKAEKEDMSTAPPNISNFSIFNIDGFIDIEDLEADRPYKINKIYKTVQRIDELDHHAIPMEEQLFFFIIIEYFDEDNQLQSTIPEDSIFLYAAIDHPTALQYNVNTSDGLLDLVNVNSRAIPDPEEIIEIPTNRFTHFKIENHDMYALSLFCKS